jgi:hypothetical protein
MTAFAYRRMNARDEMLPHGASIPPTGDTATK